AAPPALRLRQPRSLPAPAASPRLTRSAPRAAQTHEELCVPAQSCLCVHTCVHSSCTHIHTHTRVWHRVPPSTAQNPVPPLPSAQGPAEADTTNPGSPSGDSGDGHTPRTGPAGATSLCSGDLPAQRAHTHAALAPAAQPRLPWREKSTSEPPAGPCHGQQEHRLGG
uniref:Uncharacterized protein n=1 Tax=Junco hyemalis TaxID=40217 RepID=A0A8C5I867_JUNHY